MEHTTMSAEGMYNRQSQQTSAISRPTAPLFSFLERLDKLLADFLLRKKVSQPLLWQCVSTLLLGSMEHTRDTPEGMYNRQSQQTSGISRPTAPLFSFLPESLDK